MSDPTYHPRYVWCPISSCHRIAVTRQLRHGLHTKEAVMCEGRNGNGHGVSGGVSGGVVVPYEFTRRGATYRDHICIRCDLCPSNRACTFMLCQSCCSELRLDCAVQAHVDAGADRHRHTTPSRVRRLRIDSICVWTYTKVMVVVKHTWPRSPVREAGIVVYAAACYVPTSKDGKVGFAGLGLASLVRLRLDGADLQRLFVEDKYAHPAFQYGPVSYDQSGSLPRLALMYFMRVPELGRHHSLLPEEKDLSRDWDTLGSTRAWVTCHFVDEHQPRSQVVIWLPRRRLIYKDCVFVPGDFTPEDRMRLGLGRDDRIMTGPDGYIEARAHQEGPIEQGVEITLYITDAL